MSAKIHNREEYIEQAYLFRHLRERLADNLPAQEILQQIDQEILSTTRLPLAIQFLATEIKHSGLLASGFQRLQHYFTAYQAFIIASAERDTSRFSMDTALLVLQREAEFRAQEISAAGLFVYQFETLCRNRLGYDAGLSAMAQDPFYEPDWRSFLEFLTVQVGLIDLADLIYLRSQCYVMDERRTDRDFEPSLPPLFGEKEGRIAGANRGRDPLLLFGALQRHLGYPEVPRPRPRDDVGAKIEALQAKIRNLEARLHLVEGEVRGQVDLSKLGKPEILADDSDRLDLGLEVKGDE